MDQRKGIQSVEIGFRVLESLERALRPMALGEIAEAAGMSMSKCHFYLVSFTRLGLVAQDFNGGHYRLGPAALRLGLSALAQVDAVEAARVQMTALREETGDTVFVSVWGDYGPTVVSRLDGEKVAPFEVRVGAVMPVLRSATGNVFLGFLPRAVTRAFVQRELAATRRERLPQRRLTQEKIEQLVGQVKKHRLGRTSGGVITGIVAIAAPVVDAAGALRCVLTLMGQEGNLDIGYTGAPALALVRATRRASAACGFTGNI